MSRYAHRKKADEQDYIPATIEQPRHQAQLYMPDVVFTQVFVDAFKTTPIITWKTPVVKEKKVVPNEFKYYKMCVDKEDKGKDGTSTLLHTYYMGIVDANGKNLLKAQPTTTTTTPTTTQAQTTMQPTLASEIASIQALPLDDATKTTCINALISKYGGK